MHPYDPNIPENDPPMPGSPSGILNRAKSSPLNNNAGPLPAGPPPPRGASEPPSGPFWGSEDQENSDVSVQEVLRAQIRIAASIQRMLAEQADNLDPRELKDLISAASSIISMVQRSEALLQTIATYEMFVSVTIGFLKNRSDSLGEDLVALLKEEGRKLGIYQEISELSDGAG